MFHIGERESEGKTMETIGNRPMVDTTFENGLRCD